MKPQNKKLLNLRKRSLAGILLGIVTVLLCELPIILLLLGFGGLAASVNELGVPSWVGLIGAAVFTIGAAGLIRFYHLSQAAHC